MMSAFCDRDYDADSLLSVASQEEQIEASREAETLMSSSSS